MAVTYWPFDAGAGANVAESQWTQMARLWLRTGVLVNALNQLAVFADSTGMQVKVMTGQAWIEGHFQSDTQVTLPITTSNPTNPRIDRVVVRLDWAANTIGFLVLTGTPAASPVAPTLTQTLGTTWDLPLAQVLVGTNVATIAAGVVTDQRVLTVPGGGGSGMGLPARAWDTDGVAGTQAELRQVALAGASHKDWVLTFDGTAAEYVDASFSVPPSYAGTPVNAFISWRTTATSGNAYFRIDGLVTGTGGDLGASMVTLFAAAPFAAQGTASRKQLSTLPWTGPLPVKNDHLQLRFWRRAEDVLDTINAVDIDVLDVTFAFA